MYTTSTLKESILTYLDKTRRSTYTNMSLVALVTNHNVGTQMDFDTGNVIDFEKLTYYLNRRFVSRWRLPT